MRKLCVFILKLLGWNTSLSINIPNKCVICIAPHTSNWDFFIGLIFYTAIGGNPHILMKKELFFFPLNLLLKALGGIPVDRKQNTSLSEQMVKFFRQSDSLELVIAPEGTRKANAEWKSGFYYIAKEAEVPIIPAYIDYSKKEVGVFPTFHPTGDAEKDIATIKSYYTGIQGKHPQQFLIKDNE